MLIQYYKMLEFKLFIINEHEQNAQFIINA